MSRPLSLIFCVATSLLLLCACDQPVADNFCRVETLKVSSSATSMVRQYSIETASLKKIALEEASGSNSTSIAPSIMTDEQTTKAEVTVTVELNGLGEQAHVTVNMVVITESFTARSDETLAVPGTTDLASILTEFEPTEDFSSTATLLRLTSGEKYLQVVIK